MTVLQRIAGERFSEITREWEGETVVILGGGPSLTLEQVMYVRAARVLRRIRAIAVNDAYLWAPWADVHYAADAKWHAWHTEGVAKPIIGLTADQVRACWENYRGEKCTIQCSDVLLRDETVNILRNRDYPNHGEGLSRDPRCLATGRNSGFQAVNIAVLAGVKRIILLGFDAREPGAGDARSHWHGGHPKPSSAAIFPAIRRSFSAAEADLVAAGVEVLNASPGSAIDSFPKVRLEEVL